MAIRLDRFCDIETESWTEFVLGGIYDREGNYHSYRDRDLFMLDLLETGGEVWTWNGGLYDIIAIAEWLIENNIRAEVSRSGTRITRLRAGKLVLRDAVALLPMSLEKAIGILPDETILRIAGTLDPAARKDLGKVESYENISRTMSAELFADLDRYLRRDCEFGFEIVDRLQTIADEHDYELTGTVGGSSYKTAATQLGIEPVEWDWRAYRFARDAYYGGRTQVFQPTAEHGHRSDIHSAYPAALRSLELPVGEWAEARDETAARWYQRRVPGIYRARVTVPESFIPPLPLRLDDGSIAYPFGRFVGTWALPELAYAEEECGVTVEPIRALTWDDERVVFAEYIDRVWRHRADATNKTEAAWVKWFANSLTGKFGEDPAKERVLLCPDLAQIQDKLDRKNPWFPIDPGLRIWGAPFWRISDCAHVHWAAYLTGQTRVTLHRQLTADGRGGLSAVYCDTDSVYSTTRRREAHGPELGQWGYDGEMRDWVCLAKKLYRYEDPATGEIVVRAKGMSGLTPAEFEELMAGEAISRDRGVMGFRSAARVLGAIKETDEPARLFRRKHLTRSSKADGLKFGDRIRRADGRTYPREAKELWRDLRKPRPRTSKT